MTSYGFKRKIQHKTKNRKQIIIFSSYLGVVEDETVAIAWLTYVE